MRSLRYLNTILTVLALLLAVQIWTTWTSGASSISLASPASAQSRSSGNKEASTGGGIPDAGAQRKEMIDLLKKQTQQSEDLMNLLKSGQVRVRLEEGAGGGKGG